MLFIAEKINNQALVITVKVQNRKKNKFSDLLNNERIKKSHLS